MGQKDLKTYSIGFESEGGESGDEFDYSDLVAETYGTDHTKFRGPEGETDELPGPAAIARDVRADDEPRRRRLLPALPRGLEVDQGGAVRPGRRRGARRLRLVPADRRGAARGRRRGVRAGRSSTARTTRSASWCAPEFMLADDPSPAFVAEHFGRRGADDARRRGAAPRHHDDARRRPGEARRQHDDGLGARGARAVPRPRVRRARRRLPARAQDGRRRQGRAQGGRRGCSPTRSSTARRATSRCRRSASSPGRCSSGSPMR